jgi:ABC-type Zn uptake system ZnuABC Zn-binding protein ZnuA
MRERGATTGITPFFRAAGGLAQLALLITLAPNALAEVRVVTTNPTLGDLTRQVGGEQVRVTPTM